MTSPVARERQYGTVVWNRDPRFLTCPADHLYRFRDVGMQRDHRRLSGHDFFRCTECKPPSYFFVVFSTTPDPIATCYLINEETWKAFVNDPSPRPLSTLEVLFLIKDPLGRSYHPSYQAPR
jgi:hypothetical protein